MKRILLALSIVIMLVVVYTLPVSAASSLVVYSTSSDGDYYGWGVTYSAAREADDALTAADDVGYIDLGQLLNANYAIYRGALFFDTSSLPDDARIISATLSVYITAGGAGWYVPLADNAFVVVDGSLIDEPIVVADYGDLFSSTTSFGSLLYSDMVELNYNDIMLNSSGLAAISRVGDTKFGLRALSDINGVAPDAGNEEKQATIHTFEGSNPPRLTIVYTVPPAVPFLRAAMPMVVVVGIILAALGIFRGSVMLAVSGVVIGIVGFWFIRGMLAIL